MSYAGGGAGIEHERLMEDWGIAVIVALGVAAAALAACPELAASWREVLAPQAVAG